MGNRRQSDNAQAAVHDLASGGMFSTPGERGLVIRCLQGQAWLTQEGDQRDYFLAANTRYQSAACGLIVVNALVDRTRIVVSRAAPKPAGDWLRNAVWLDAGFSEAALRRARLERAHFVAALIARAWSAVRRALHGVGAAFVRSAPPPGRRSCQQ